MLGCGADGAEPGAAGSGGAGGQQEPGWGGVDSSILVESVVIPGFQAPPNPSSGEQTPAELNQARFVRYRYELAQDEDPRAIIIGVPGFLGGGPSFDGVARSLVRQGAERGLPIEFWAIDRRSNGMEDLAGMNAAGEELGEEGIEAVLTANAERPLAELHGLIMEAVARHGDQQDDQTLLLARVLG